MLKAVHKESVKREQNRKKLDQFGRLISDVDDFLFNHFTAWELCKLRLELLAILSLKKEHLQHNFDDETNLLLFQFEEQVRTNHGSNDFCRDIRNLVTTLRKQGKFQEVGMDPVKMYFQKTLKSFIL